MPPPFATLSEGTRPLVFPLEAPSDALLDRLAREGIAAEPIWPLPRRALPAPDFPAAVAWRKRFLALPVHQELRPGDVERIALALRGPGRVRRLRLEPIPDLESARGEWSALAEANANLFSTWEWASIWLRHFGRGRRVLLTAVRSAGGEPVAILPLYVWLRRPLRIVRFVGHGAADELGPVSAEPDRKTAALALRELLDTDPPCCDVLVGDDLPSDRCWSTLLRGRVLRREPSPALRVGDGGWEQLLAQKSPGFRKRLRYEERRLAREDRVEFRLSDDPGRLSADLDRLFSLHRARWGGETPFARAEDFHREFAACAQERGWLRLWLLELGGRAVAAWYGFRFAGAELHYQSGRDPAWERFSVGFLLLAHTIREALAEGAREYRFLSGGESYKYRFANVEPTVETLVIPRTLRGRAALEATVAASRLGARGLLGRLASR